MPKSEMNVAIIGLGFGTQFIPIYKRHPRANMVAICRRSEKELHDIGDIFGVPQRYTKYADVLADPHVDFVHINTPIPDHGPMSGVKEGRATLLEGRMVLWCNHGYQTK